MAPHLTTSRYAGATERKTLPSARSFALLVTVPLMGVAANLLIWVGV
jgi:hypothetical protein